MRTRAVGVPNRVPDDHSEAGDAPAGVSQATSNPFDPFALFIAWWYTPKRRRALSGASSP
jgi:hypothetical protein